MTSKKQLKARIRERMAKTGERYTTAHRHLAGTTPTTSADGGYALRGGTHPESSTIANILANHGLTAGHTQEPLTEALIFGVGGGLGAGYILWEFQQHEARTGARILTLGFRNQWQYTGNWTERAAARLGVPIQAHRTGGVKGAAARLSSELAEGRPCMVWPDRQLVGYWYLPPHLEAHGGHPIVVYAENGEALLVDDRNLAPLTVPQETMQVARGRVVSYRNLLMTLSPNSEEIDEGTLRQAVTDGIADCVGQLGGSSDSFALPAWRKWARLMTDTRKRKAWPNVFADRIGLAGALLSAWEGVEPAGMTGGNLRTLYADFLDEAAGLTDEPALAGCAQAFRAAGALWHELAETALPDTVAEFDRMRTLIAAVLASVIGEGDAGRSDAEASATELWKLRATYDRGTPLDEERIAELFQAMSERLTAIYQAETEAVERLGRTIQV